MKRNSSIRKKAAAAVALAAILITSVGGTLAYRDFKQHKSNELGGIDLHYEARLVEDFVERPDWKVEDGDVKKEIRVANVGRRDDGYGNVYVRLQLKEYMEIGEVTYVETEKRYMIDIHGQYITRPTQEEAARDFPGHNYAELTDAVTGASGWFIETQAHDPNGQMGKHVITNIIVGDADPVIPDSMRAVNLNHHGVMVNGELVTRSDECDYPVHPWDYANGLDVREYIEAYITWGLNTGAIIRYSDWILDPVPVAKWIVDDSPNGDGWAYWGQPLLPESETANLLDTVKLISQPDGSFYYVIHVDMEAVSLDELIKNDPDLGWNGDIRDSYIQNAPSARFNGATPTEVEVGKSVNSPSVTIGPEGSDQSPLKWSSSNPSLATVDQNGVVTGVAKGGPVTITVTGPNGGRESYTITVVEGETTTTAPVTVPATGVTINGGNKNMTVGQTENLTITKVPGGTTDTPVWSSSDSAIVEVDQNGKITAKAPGTATITVTMEPSGVSNSITVTVTAAAPEELPLKNGEGPYEALSDDFRFNGWIRPSSFIIADLENECTFKLKDILAASFGTDYSGITVTAKNTALNQYFSIGADHLDGDLSILSTYIGDKASWDATIQADDPPPTFEVELVLHKSGYADTNIKVIVSYHPDTYYFG
ncbi:MAG: Ig-like domain-containing protein [Oscillospiraceae bacterium]|nr:Ig-like domain-containing protein [Oscillospiraceae bacterium]